MSSIDKIQISGIRSFNPKVGERQSVEFHKPLTIILGKNGAGKTTIIEALLNACTGEMPPGSAGTEKCSFIYDPRTAGENEVKAQIRLNFTCHGGKEMQVIRSFQASQTKTKTSFQTLDSTLAYKTGEGKIQSGTYRVAQVDAMIPELLGVSKAVLANVLFCHQEASNWPLGPPSDLKHIFDDIFASTRYVVALDKLRDSAKNYREQQRQQEALIIAFKEHREQARQLGQEIEGKEESVRLHQMQNKEIEPRLQQLTDAIHALDSTSANAEALTREGDLLRGKIEQKELQLQRLKYNKGSKQTLDQLKEMQNDFSGHMKRMETQAKEKEDKGAVIEDSRRKVELTLSEARSKVFLAEQREREHKQHVSDLQALVSSVNKEFVAGEGAVDSRALLRVEQSYTEKLSKMKEKISKEESGFDEKREQSRQKRDEILRCMDADSKEKDMKEVHMVQVKRRLDQLNVSAVDPKHVQRLQAKVSQLEERVKETQKRRKEGKSFLEAQNLMEQLKQDTQKAGDLRKEMQNAETEREDHCRLSYLREQTTGKKEEAEKLLTALLPTLNNNGITVKKASLDAIKQVQSQLDTIQQRKDVAIQQAENEVRSADREVALAEEQVNQKRERLRELERLIQQNKAICLAAVKTEENLKAFETFFKEIEDSSRANSREYTNAEAMAGAYESFVETAKKEKKCVVCDRSLTDAELQSFIQLNTARQQNSPALLTKLKKKADETALELQQLRRIEPTIRLLHEQSAEQPALISAVKSLEEKMESKKSLLASLQTKFDELKKQKGSLTALQESLTQVKTRANEHEGMQAEILARERRTQSHEKGSVKRSLDLIQGEFDAVTEHIQGLNEKLQKTQNESAPQPDESEKELLDAKQQLMEAKLAEQRYTDVKEQEVQLQKEIEENKSRLQQIATKRPELQNELDKITQAADSMNSKHQQKINELRNECAQLEKDSHALSTCAKEVKKYIDSKQEEALSATRSVVKNSEKELQQLEKELGKTRQEVSEAKRVLDEQHRQSIEIQQQIEFLQLRQEIECDQQALIAAEKRLEGLCQEQLKQVEAILGADATSKFSKARDSCYSKKAELEKIKAQHLGSIEQLQLDVADRKGQLAKDKYKDIDKRYASTFIKLQTTELTVQDIEKYFKALEKAVSSYHQEKIDQINRIIADLWRQTYRGSDIDSVEIRSEDDSSTGIQRRSYKYRVVMKRGAAELDMRGRCSAGQKVLVSVIVRLALSDAFCCDCGFLALDEPTTNLDDDNARSLAEALKELITVRRSVKHFQLIVITHDESFVRTLGSTYANRFYFVQKDREGSFSTIQERHYDELFS